MKKTRPFLIPLCLCVLTVSAITPCYAGDGVAGDCASLENKSDFLAAAECYYKTDKSKALSLYIKSYEKEKNYEAALKIGDCYYYGYGVSAEDPAKAAEYYEAGASLGSGEAAKKAGDMYYGGKGVKKDHGAALKYYIQAERLLPKSYKGETCGLIGDIYYADDASQIAVNFGQAYKYYLKAYYDGYYASAKKIASMFDEGKGFEKDAAKARMWLENGAKNGDSSAAKELLGRCMSGSSGEKDNVCAYTWASVLHTVYPSDSDYVSSVSELEQKLSAEEISAAKLKAGAYAKKYSL